MKQRLKKQYGSSVIFTLGSWLQERFSRNPCNIAALQESDPRPSNSSFVLRYRTHTLLTFD